MGKLTVVNGATTKCTGSGQSSFLLVPPDLQIEVDGLNPATIAHHTPGDNILPFGPCKFLGGGQCVPFTLSPWEKGEPSVPFGADPSLNMESYLKCDLGGKIELDSSGQSKPFLSTDCKPSLSAQLFAEWYGRREYADAVKAQMDAENESKDESGGGSSPVMPMLGIAGTVAVADGPLPFGDVIGLGIVAAAGGIAIANSIPRDDSDDTDISDDKDYEAEEAIDNAPKADDLISGSLKGSDSYHSELGGKTKSEIDALAKLKGNLTKKEKAIKQKAKQMKKLIDQGERLRNKGNKK